MLIDILRREKIAAVIAGSLLILPACSGGGTSSQQIPSVSNDSANNTTSSQANSRQQTGSSIVTQQSNGMSRSTDATSYVAETPATADAFVNSVGTDTKFGYTGSPYDVNWAPISAALVGSGIKHIRENGNVNIGWYMQRLSYLASNGIKHSTQALMGPNGTPAHITADIMAYGPNTVDFIEPQNEYDGNAQQDPNWVANIKALQQVEWSTIRSNPAFSGITVLGPALVNAAHQTLLGPMDSIEDGANLHYATCDFNPGTSGLASITKLMRTSTITKPIYTTEDGYTDDMSRGCSLSDAVIAKYVPRTVAERWNIGEPRAYFFQFADMPTDKVFGAMGLLHADGSPKPQYTTLKSMLGLLTDTGGANFTPKPLSYSITLAGPSVHHTLVQKQDGTYYLMLWQEVSSWDHKARVPLTVAPQNVLVNLQQMPTSAQVYTYASNGQLLKRGLPLSKSIRVSVTDTVSFVELK